MELSKKITSSKALTINLSNSLFSFLIISKVTDPEEPIAFEDIDTLFNDRILSCQAYTTF